MKSNIAATGTTVVDSLHGEGVLARVSAFLGQRLHAWRNRQALAELLHFDDRQLADIGVTRGDIEWALSQPLSRDTTRELDSLRRGNAV